MAAEVFIAILAVYGLAGLLFAIVFVTIGIQRFDPVAEHAPVSFRLMVLPGVAALWPLLLWGRPSPFVVCPVLRRTHFRIWVVLPLLLFALFIAGLLARRSATPPNPQLHWEQYR